MASRDRQGPPCYPGQGSDATKPIPATTPRTVAFADLGADYLDRTAKRLVRRLDALGYNVMLRPKTATA